MDVEAVCEGVALSEAVDDGEGLLDVLGEAVDDAVTLREGDTVRLALIEGLKLGEADVDAVPDGELDVLGETDGVPLRATVRDGDRVAADVPVGLADSEGVRLAVALRLPLALELRVCVALIEDDGVMLRVGEPLVDGVTEVEEDTVGVTEPVGVTLGLKLGDDDTLREAVTVDDTEDDGVMELLMLAVGDGDAVTDAEDPTDTLAERVTLGVALLEAVTLLLGVPLAVAE